MEHLFTKDIQTLIITYSLRVIAALLILLIGLVLAKVVQHIVKKLLMKAHIEKTLVNFISNIVRAFMLIVITIAVLNKLGIQTGSLIAVLGAIGLAMSLAFKNSLSNLAAGVLIILHQPFKIDDTISVNGVTGTVNDINIFMTKMITAANESIYVPNSKLTENFITNYSQQKTRRIEIIIGVGYDDDIQHVKNTLSKLIEDNPDILKTPAPTIAIKALSDSTVDFVIQAWTQKENFGKLNLSLYEQIKILFDREKISIPYPQHDVHFICDAPPPVKNLT